MTPTIESVGLRKRFGRRPLWPGLTWSSPGGQVPAVLGATANHQPMIWAAPKTSTPHLQAARRTPGCNQHTAERQGG